jgi:hypothetical protein
MYRRCDQAQIDKLEGFNADKERHEFYKNYQTKFNVAKCIDCPKIDQIDPQIENEKEVPKIILKESGVKDKIGR